MITQTSQGKVASRSISEQPVPQIEGLLVSAESDARPISVLGLSLPRVGGLGFPGSATEVVRVSLLHQLLLSFSMGRGSLSALVDRFIRLDWFA